LNQNRIYEQYNREEFSDRCSEEISIYNRTPASPNSELQDLKGKIIEYETLLEQSTEILCKRPGKA
jgi:hypothetical protein